MGEDPSFLLPQWYLFSPISHLPMVQPPDSIPFQGHSMAYLCHNEPLSNRPTEITTVITMHSLQVSTLFQICYLYYPI